MPETIEDESVEVEALTRNTLELFQRLVSLVSHLPDELVTAALNVDDPRTSSIWSRPTCAWSRKSARSCSSSIRVKEKLDSLNAFIPKELDVLELGKKLQTEVQEELGKSQREYYLREQLKAIQRELGEASETEAEITELRAKIEESGMPEEAAQGSAPRARPAGQAAAGRRRVRRHQDLSRLADLAALEQEHRGRDRHREGAPDSGRGSLRSRKDQGPHPRIPGRREAEAGRWRRRSDDSRRRSVNREPILCFVGPPGVGKTSLAQSIARALGREMTRMSLGGVRDEAEIRGHRRTYVGAMPGRIIQAIRRAGTNDPVFVLDEVDKLGNDWRGDPSSALLEVLDPEQNNSFRDHYLDVAFDLSKVMFIATANMLDTIPAPLRDRMEIIEPGRLHRRGQAATSRASTWFRSRSRRTACRADTTTGPMTGLLQIIQHYTREAGVRNLEREIGSGCRKIATRGRGRQRGRARRSGPKRSASYLGPAALLLRRVD